jgi:EAL domain-containing protein (putative c-di-GMP-specific phosphodiesterase class I)
VPHFDEGSCCVPVHEFELFYQPVVNVHTRRTIGFEALLRWHHPERGLVSPDRFIPMVEETGLIVPIGEWVLSRACLEAATWPAGLKVAVNLSAVQFIGQKLLPAVTSALKIAGLDPRRLELEITESVCTTPRPRSRPSTRSMHWAFASLWTTSVRGIHP